ncbi:unnamed protein product, partial [Rotaria sp. Silwood1]
DGGACCSGRGSDRSGCRSSCGSDCGGCCSGRGSDRGGSRSSGGSDG